MQNENQPNSNPQLKDLLDAWKRNMFINMNCHAIATVETFDADNQTVSASINYLKGYFDGEKTVLKNYPLLLDCPVITMSGGGASLTFPIEKGDTCLILFNDRSIEEWFASGQVTELSSNRTHSLSDGIALVGLRSTANKLEDYDENRSVLRKGSMAMGVGDKVLITKNYPTSNETLNTYLQDLCTQVANLATIVSGVAGGGGAAPIPGLVNAIATQIGELLE